MTSSAMAESNSEHENSPGFPLYRGFRRRLPVEHELFEIGNLERELLAKQTTLQVCVKHAVCR